MKYTLYFLIFLFGCEEIVLRTENSGASLKPLRAQVNLSPQGVGKLFIASTPEGLLVRSEPAELNLEGQIYILGPIDERFTIQDQSISTQPNLISAGLKLDAFNVRLALRNNEGPTKICRYTIRGESVDIRADVEIGSTLRVLSPPTIILSEFTIIPIGECEFSFDSSSLLWAVKNYLIEALKSASTLVFEGSPLNLIGLPNGAISLMTSTGGSLNIEQQLNEDGVRIENEKVTIPLDFGLSTNRSSCIPPLQYSPPQGHPSLGSEGDNDLSFSLSKSLLADLFSSSVLAGLFCREGEAILLNETKLDEIGLGHLRLTSSLKVFFQPASLPELDFQDKVIHLRWPLITLDTHADIFGASQRVVFIAASMELTLRPSVVEGRIVFDIESVSLSTSDAKSKWNSQLLPSLELDRWTRRLVLLSFEKGLSLTSPLNPEIDLKLKSLNSNATDLILNYDID